MSISSLNEMSYMKGKHVVVTTVYRGVFYGVLESRLNAELILTDARLCVYWSAETKGFLGLAKTGPLKGSRVSPAVPRISLAGITSISECTEEAVKQWESEPWN